MISFDNHFKTQANKILGNPFVTLLISILIATVYLYLGKEVKRPAYYISEPELILEQSDGKITILYDSVKLKNLYAVNLVLWNEGSRIVDVDDFVSSNLPTFYSKDSIRFISCSMTQRSRTDLVMATKIEKNEITFQIDNDEALENADGVNFRIIYTKYGKKPAKLKFRSRIKETKDGFVFKDLKNYKLKDSKISLIFLWTLLFLLLAIRIVVLMIFKKTITFKNSEIIFVFIYLLMLSYKSYIYVFFSANIEWLKW